MMTTTVNLLLSGLSCHKFNNAIFVIVLSRENKRKKEAKEKKEETIFKQLNTYAHQFQTNQ